MFSKVLIANRGEIAVRIARTCRELGVATVAVFSDLDANARHVALADESVHLPGESAAETYLNLPAVLEAARRTGAQAVHPGYGFFSERGDVAEAVEEAGLVWIGPPPEAARAVGDKVRARQLASGAGVSVVPGTLQPVQEPGEVHAFGEEHGYPIAIKAAGGGGGRGLRVAAGPEEVPEAFAAATREAEAWFGSPGVYLERYLERPKHVEVQVLAPAAGEAMWLGARDCSLQRRHQKLVEETPPPLHAGIVPAMGEAAVAVANACGYVNAGTVEFLVDEDGRFYFLEVNARLQVEHTITEEVLGLDLVACQLRIAAGEPVGFTREDLAPRGHAIECRINAENPARRFLPGPGRIERYREPGGLGVRVDSGYAEGDEVPRAYDSLLAKLVVWGPTREEARRRMLRALREFDVAGVPTTIPAHIVLLEHPAFVDGSYTTRTVEGGALDSLVEPNAPARGPAKAADCAPSNAAVSSEAAASEAAVLLVAGQAVRLWNPAMAAEAAASTATRAVAGDGVVRSPMHGTILKLEVAKGDQVQAGDPVAILEAMKMETQVSAPVSGSVTAVHVQAGEVVEAGEPIAELG
ncbi:MAG: biotin/lipoyl-binding protein [Actinomycetota bacterium]|nr:biotin/lipoyl-binding protein [Actinomycetota bacterium]